MPDRITAYDVPGVMLNQFFNDEPTLRGLYLTAVNPKKLAPAERESLAERLREYGPPGSLGEAVTNLATNPWVWFFALTTPFGGHAAGQTFKMAEQFSPFVRKHSGLLMSTFGSPLHQLRGSTIGQAASEFLDNFHRLNEEASSLIGPSLAPFLGSSEARRLGLKSLDPLAHHGEARRYLEWANNVLGQSLAGMDDIRTIPKASLVKGRPVVTTQSFGPKWNPGELENELGRLGMRNIRDSMRQATDLYAQKVFGIKNGKVDSNNILRLFRGYQNLYKQKMRGGAVEGVEVIDNLMSDDLRDQLISGQMSLQAFETMVDDLVGAPIRAGKAQYLPRLANRGWTMDKAGNLGPMSDAQLRAVRESGNLRPAGSRAPRAAGSVVAADTRLMDAWDPHDFEEAYRRGFGNQDMYDSIQRSYAILRSMHHQNSGTPAMLPRFQAFEATRRYFDQMGRSYAAFVAAPSRELLEAQKAIRDGPLFQKALDDIDQLNPLRGVLYQEGGNRAGKTLAVSKAALDALPDELPDGGLSVMDVIHADFSLLPPKDRRLRKMVQEIVVPRMMGHVGVKESLLYNLSASVRGQAERFAGSDFGKAIENSTKGGRVFMERLRDFGADDPGVADIRSLSRKGANYMFSTHIMGNPGSVMLQLFQPIVTTARYVPLRHLAQGYGKALDEMLGYATDFVKEGYGSGAVKSERIRRNFKFADPSRMGRDVLGITPEILDTVEGHLDAAAKLGPPTVVDKLYRTLMSGFEKAEWVNRSVTAHAMESWMDASKVALRPADRLNRIEEMVRATQFGGNWLNTPALFLDQNSAFSNPLIRQFMTFPVNMLTLNAVPVGGRQPGWEYWGGAARDIGRMMGLSAFVYEALKPTGFDPSRALFASSTTDLVSRFQADPNAGLTVPLPPALSVGLQFLQWVPTQDQELLKQWLPRVVPAGVGLSRLASALPDLPNSPLLGLPGSFQKKYADYGRPLPDGRVPIYNSTTHQLVEYKSPFQVISRALGVPLETGIPESELTSTLVAQREEVLRYRARALRALAGNDVAKSQRIQQEFQQRYGVPLTISRQQLKSFLDGRMVARPERVSNRAPAELRGATQQMLGSQSQLLNVSQRGLNAYGTVSQRTKAGERQGSAGLSPEAIDELKRLARSQVRQAVGVTSQPQATPAFSRFDSFR